MNFHVLTLFPEMIEQGVNTSITGRAINNGLLSINAVNIRDYAFNKHNSVDDYPYGGGAGMLMQAEPVYLAYEAVKEQIDKRKQENIKSEEVTSTEAADCSEVRNIDLQDENSKKRPLRVVYLSPQGDVFNQKMAEEMAQEEDLVLLCGHYEGIDERVLEEIVTDYVSIGDYVLTGGELPAMVMIDTIWFRECFTMMSQQNLSHFRIIFWSIRSIPDRKSGEGRKFRQSFCPDIMRILKNGEESSQSFVQWSGARIFSRRAI